MLIFSITGVDYGVLAVIDLIIHDIIDCRIELMAEASHSCDNLHVKQLLESYVCLLYLSPKKEPNVS